MTLPLLRPLVQLPPLLLLLNLHLLRLPPHPQVPFKFLKAALYSPVRLLVPLLVSFRIFNGVPSGYKTSPSPAHLVQLLASFSGLPQVPQLPGLVHQPTGQTHVQLDSSNIDVSRRSLALPSFHELESPSTSSQPLVERSSLSSCGVGSSLVSLVSPFHNPFSVFTCFSSCTLALFCQLAAYVHPCPSSASMGASALRSTVHLVALALLVCLNFFLVTSDLGSHGGLGPF